MAIKKVPIKRPCSCCNRNLDVDRNYFKINYNDSVFEDDLYLVCHDCLKKSLDNEITGYKTFIRTLMILNRPFRLDEFKAVNNDYFRYLKKVTAKTYKGEFLDSDSIISKASLDTNADTVVSLTPEELRECQLFWGIGDYTEDDYLFLMSTYEKYLNTYDVDSPTFESIIAQICQLDLDIKKKRILGADTTKETKLQLELMRNAGIAPSQEKESKNNDQQSFGMWVRRWENEMPVPEPLPQFRDVDGIAKYLENNFLSPMRKSLDLYDDKENQYQEHIDKYGISKEDLLGVGDE